MKNKIVLSKDLILSVEAVTRRIAIMGMSGSGKSNTAAVLVENFLTIGAQTVILDNDGTWYGLRLAEDGKHPAFDIPVFGGLHGDYPLDYRSGSLMASVIVERGISCILDVSDFRKGQRRQFATEFAEQLFHLKKTRRTPMMLVIEECQDFLPQRFGKDEARMVGAFEDIGKAGRKYGIGTVMISQRPQAVNKDALNQCEILIAHYTYGPQERKALADWIVDKNQNVNIVDDLTSLHEGQAYVWSPRWLRIMQKVQIDKKQTFDTAQTPVFGEKAIAATLQKIDLDEIAEMMKEAIHTAEENDPAILKRRIIDLEKQLTSARNVRPAVPEIQYIDKPILTDAQVGQLKESAERFHIGANQLHLTAIEMDKESEKYFTLIKEVIQLLARPIINALPAQPRPQVSHISMPPAPSIQSDGGLKTGQLRILTACAQYPNGVTREQLTALTGYKRSSRDTYISQLSVMDAIRTNGKIVQITQKGSALLGDDFTPLPTGEALQSYWVQRLPVGEREILKIAISNWPQEIARDELSKLTGKARSSRDTYISKLMTKRLLTTPAAGMIRASDTLFD